MADLGAMRVPPSVLPATGLQGTLACLKVFPAGWPVVQEPSRTCRGPQARCQALGPVHSPPRSSCTLVPGSWGGGRQQPGVDSFLCFWSCRAGIAAGGGGRARGAREAPLAVRIRHRDRRTRGTTLSLQGPHGGSTANTILNNPAHTLANTPRLQGSPSVPPCHGCA